MAAETTWRKLDVRHPVWDQFYSVAPFIVVGTREGGGVNMAPKHMFTALGHGNLAGFVCTPDHSTYHNIARTGTFTICFPKPDQVVVSSLTATGREEASQGKPILDALPVTYMEGCADPVLEGSAVILACDHDRTIDGFDRHSLICGRIRMAWVDAAYGLDHDTDGGDHVRAHPLLAYLAYGRYAVISDTRAFPFPARFKI